MSIRVSERKPTPRKRKAGRQTYHHGNLSQALIEATLRLVEEGGPEKVSVREAAKRAGVSSGAPFRHFPNRIALLTAVAEEATRRLLRKIRSAMAATDSDNPLLRLRAFGSAYLNWAGSNPTYFRIVSDRSLTDFDGSESMRQDNEEIRALVESLLSEAQRRGMLQSDDLTHLPLFGRALVYGLARMLVDGHMGQWSVPGRSIQRSFQIVLDLFVDGLRKQPAPSSYPATGARRRKTSA